VAIFREASRNMPDVPAGPVNPYGITLNRDAWQKDGLFDAENAVDIDELAATSMQQVRVISVSEPVKAEAVHAF
jgi:hypothetical protein